MGITDSMKKWIGLEDIDEDDEISEEEINSAKEKISKERAAKELNKPMDGGMSQKMRPVSQGVRPPEKHFATVNTGAFKMVLIEPKNFGECPKLVDSLKGRRPVIINLEKIETEEARKIFDFMSGATYALNGNVQKVANNIFIFAPENVDISANHEERPGSAFTFNTEDNINWR